LVVIDVDLQLDAGVAEVCYMLSNASCSDLRLCKASRSISMNGLEQHCWSIDILMSG
jgi:hypothetical protein